VSDDHEALRALVQRYARAADDRDVDALAALFHPDAEISGARGALSRDAWLDTMRAPRAFPSSMHLIGDPLITLGPGPDRATLDTYAVVYQLADPKGDGCDLTLGIRYLDGCVRHEGAWVIAHRTAETRWMR
jgi:hypothetical protein